MLRSGLISCLLVGALAACGDEDNNGPDASSSDASPMDAAPDAGMPPTGDPGIEIGIGEGRFQPLEDAAVVDMVEGFQVGGRFGGHHIFTSVRITGLARDELAMLRVSFTSTSGVEQARSERNPDRAPIRDNGMGGLDLAGMTPRLDDCCAVEGKDIVMRAVLQTDDGQTFEDERHVRASTCPAEGPSICP